MVKQNYVEEFSKVTSVKKVGVIEKPGDWLGIADFDHMPVFSVFDYGTIKPSVPLDNSTIALMGAFNFGLLKENANISSHFISLVDNTGEVYFSAQEAITKGVYPTIMRVNFGNRLMPQHVEAVKDKDGKTINDGYWDYSMFKEAGNMHVQPIEFISRNALPESSSVWKRVARGEITLQDLGLPDDFKKGDSIPEELRPILDYSTKFEPEDRYLSPAEAQELMHVTDRTFAYINLVTRRASNFMTDYAASRGFKRLDGKVEYVGTMLADNVCTWHEDRLVHEESGLGISKQRIRDKVKQLNPEWYKEINRAKEQARKEKHPDFRLLMDSKIKESYVSPSSEFFNAINTLFRAGTNQWVGKKHYDVYPGKNENLEENLNRAVEDFKKVA